MSETKLSITKEQAEAFANWKAEYIDDINFAEAVLQQALGNKKCDETQMGKNLGKMKEIVATVEIEEGLAKFFAKEITSNMGFGAALYEYKTNLSKALWEQQDKITVGMAEKFSKAAIRLFEIFEIQ